MPTYEYACPDCGIVEVFQSIKEKSLTRCPQCKKRKVARMLSGGAGIIFKGSGFWETDYNRSDDYKKKSKQDAGGGDAPATETKSKTQAQPKKADPTPSTTTTPGSNSGDAKPPPTTPTSPTGPKAT
jgi:putative FmdB family regulatory protein